MGSCLFLLHYFPLITSIVLLGFPLSNGENSNYTGCSILFSCGNVKNVGYPFWGDDRPKFCGIPDLKLTCPGDNNQTHDQIFPSLNVFNKGSVKLSVISINISSHTIKFSLHNLFKGCYVTPTENISLISSLKQVDANNYISLSYNCTNCESRYPSKSYTCTVFEGQNGTAYYFGGLKPSNFSKIGNKGQCSCKNKFSFPVDKRVVEELKNNASASLFSTLVKWPIQGKYVANFTACSECQNSGGRCGSSQGPSSGQFVCYCQDGHSMSVCPHSHHKKKENFGLILGSGIGVLLLMLVAIIGIWYRKKLNFIARSASLDCSASELERGTIYFGVPLFSYNELVEATSNFDQSKELGNGGFGIVYYGKLKDGREVAVKRLYEKSCRRLEQFMNEVQILTRLKHQNLVSLYGCTSQHCRELLLVYEYVKNGTVADHLYSERAKSGLLPWPLRLRIAIETASALSYLHASEIIHRDVKTNNILLDSNFCAKVADFGLSRLFPIDVTHVSTTPQGTPGYIDPEYHQCYQLTNKSDVYSFGVVLIELVSSLPAIDLDRHKHEINLSNYAMNRIQRCAFDELVDPQLGFNSDFKVRRTTRLVAELAYQCLQHNKEFRPSMDEVLEVLKSIEDTDYEALQAEETAASVAIESSEALQTEETDENAAVEYHDALQAEDTVKNAGLVVEKMHTSDSLSSPVADDHAELLSTDRSKYSSSPISVIGKWISRTTTPSSSNGSK